MLGNFHGRQHLAAIAHLHHAFQIAAREEASDLSSVVILIVPEIGQLTVSQKNERCAERLGIGQRLLLGGIWIDGVPLGLNHGEWPTALVVEDIVGATGCRLAFFNCFEYADEFADDAQVALGAGVKDEVAISRIGIERL